MFSPCQRHWGPVLAELGPLLAVTSTVLAVTSCIRPASLEELEVSELKPCLTASLIFVEVEALPRSATGTTTKLS
jgi:hypothetical protein